MRSTPEKPPAACAWQAEEWPSARYRNNRRWEALPVRDQKRACAQQREILKHVAHRPIGGNLIIGRDCGLGIGLRKLGRFTHACKMAIAGRAVTGDVGEGRLSLAAFARLGERDGSFEGGAGLGSLLGLPPHVSAPSCNRQNQQNGGSRDVIAVAVPQLLELFSSNFLVDFVKNVGHEPRNPILATGPRG